MDLESSAQRLPAIPLVAHDPYFSVWSMADRLTDEWTRHWTGAANAMCGMARIDGKTYRFAGPEPRAAEPMTQRKVTVLPTRTIYQFEAAGVELTLTFLTPALPEDLNVLSRPLTYLVWDARATDGHEHRVSLYLDVTGEWVVDNPSQGINASHCKVKGLRALRAGASEQKMLARAGDNLRTEWGYLYLAAPADEAGSEAVASDGLNRGSFLREGVLPENDDLDMPRPVARNWPTLAFTFDLGKVGQKPVRRMLMMAYDDIFSIEYLNQRLRPYWRRDGDDAADLLQAGARDFKRLDARCREFDAELMADLSKAGGEKYARLCAAAYRQCLAAHKLAADTDGRPLLFSKENFSNGCIATVDVTYPSAPFFLLLNPTLLRAMLTPVLDYANSPRWRFPFAPHDLGTYPLANGQVYGGGEKGEENQMPVEECGNLLILAAALAHAENSGEYARRYWPLLTRWAEYLAAKGLNPESQLCTDDFAGHLGGNTNLSLKAIVALGGYAQLAERLGEKETAARYQAMAQQMAGEWQKMAADGDHYRLAFDQQGSWSQKYNIVWDKLLGLKLFPPEVARTEVAYYKKVQNRFGLPLDNRKTYTKLDWILWSATLAESEEDFRALTDPLTEWLSNTPSRVPLTDWYDTVDGKQVGFQARSVVGGLYIKLLADPELWQKWARRAMTPVADGPVFAGTQSLYHGYTRTEFQVDGCACSVVAPERPLPGRPWIWRAEFFDAFPQIDLALLARGFYLGYMNVGNTFGCPSAMKHFDVFYRVMTEEYGLSRKPVLEGLSRGGLYVYNWGAAHPEQVGCILGDNPVCDFKSWPGGKGTGPGSKDDWEKLIQDYGFASEQEALAYPKNPIDNLEPLAKHKIPVLHLAGDADEVVPYAENTVVLKERYEKLGGNITVIVKPGGKHHPHGLEDPTPAVHWILDALHLR